MSRLPEFSFEYRSLNWRKLCLVGLLAVGLQQLLGGVWIKGKAQLAQRLIADAWEESRRTGVPVPPWSWADTWPVARMWIPRLGVDLVVLNSDSGQALAFGPGHLPASALPGMAGVSVVAGHRDTHFSFMADIESGDRVLFELPGSARREFQVTRIEVVDSARRPLLAYKSQAGPAVLLVTCYPLDATRAGGSLRYMVTLERGEQQGEQGQLASTKSFALQVHGW